ncbi:hypothetical protein ADJ70_14375 [Olsenella sp. oral taxon 807]|nr:hypothetical protein ADJ70_14375 [Olsenella sp. oral taxon 807]
MHRAPQDTPPHRVRSFAECIVYCAAGMPPCHLRYSSLLARGSLLVNRRPQEELHGRQQGRLAILVRRHAHSPRHQATGDKRLHRHRWLRRAHPL